MKVKEIFIMTCQHYTDEVLESFNTFVVRAFWVFHMERIFNWFLGQNISLSPSLSLSKFGENNYLSLLSSLTPLLPRPPFIKLANFFLLGFLGWRWIFHHGFLFLPLSQEQLEAWVISQLLLLIKRSSKSWGFGLSKKFELMLWYSQDPRTSRSFI
jgi:hypothetical protein